MRIYLGNSNERWDIARDGGLKQCLFCFVWFGCGWDISDVVFGREVLVFQESKVTRLLAV
jgi:hypothetical protein